MIAAIATIVLLDIRTHSYLVVIHIAVLFYRDNFCVRSGHHEIKKSTSALFSLELFCFELVLETSVFTKYCLCHHLWA